MAPRRESELARKTLRLDWLESVARAGRFQTYRAKLDRAFRLQLDGRVDEILKQITPVEFIEVNFEASHLIEVWREFQDDDSQILAEKLSRIVKGQPLTSNEGEKYAAPAIC